MDLSPTFPKTHQNVKHHISMYIQEKNITEDLAAWARPLASIHMENLQKKKENGNFWRGPWRQYDCFFIYSQIASNVDIIV
jgi:hypothetical protein